MECPLLAESGQSTAGLTRGRYRPKAGMVGFSLSRTHARLRRTALSRPILQVDRRDDLRSESFRLPNPGLMADVEMIHLPCRFARMANELMATPTNRSELSAWFQSTGTIKCAYSVSFHMTYGPPVDGSSLSPSRAAFGTMIIR